MIQYGQEAIGEGIKPRVGQKKSNLFGKVTDWIILDATNAN
jgi:hypothetical protein